MDERDERLLSRFLEAHQHNKTT